MSTLTAPDTDPDPIDQLIPPPRRWWVRLAVGLSIVLIVGFGSAVVGFGYVYPQPDCCGSSDGSALMTLTPDGQAVVVQTSVFNSSSRDLEVLWANAVLPGARVLDVAFIDPTVGQTCTTTGTTTNCAGPVLPVQATPLPARLRGTQSARIAITFAPEVCRTDGPDWGSVRLRLDVVNRWLPSIDRTYTLPDPVVREGTDQLSVLPPDDNPRWSQIHDPLEAACALLGR
jgi:hypothetical protein